MIIFLITQMLSYICLIYTNKHTLPFVVTFLPLFANSAKKLLRPKLAKIIIFTHQVIYFFNHLTPLRPPLKQRNLKQTAITAAQKQKKHAVSAVSEALVVAKQTKHDKAACVKAAHDCCR
jgi:hypothetical protein